MKYVNITGDLEKAPLADLPLSKIPGTECKPWLHHGENDLEENATHIASPGQLSRGIYLSR